MMLALMFACVGMNSGAELTPSEGNDHVEVQWLPEWLVIEPTGKRARAPISVDGLTYQWARGELGKPAAGGVVTSITDEAHVWTAATAGDDGWLRSPALSGGHAAASVSVDQARIMLLEAEGHSMVYCNGTPRVGDPYGTGYVRLPVALRAGENIFLFGVGRGQVRARLVPLRAEAQLNVDDVTLPDAVVGEHGDLLGAIVLINGTLHAMKNAWMEVRLGAAEPVRTPVPVIERLTVRKVPFHFLVPADLPAGELPLSIRLFRGDHDNAQMLDSADVGFRVRTAEEVYKRTFLSAIDGSVQYYAVRRATEPGEQALFLTLHGASVEATGQARAYAAKSWGHIVAPTNRRPFGFDWEDWGRWDALEVLDQATATLDIDPTRIYLTGHSMGGHGTWQLGVHYPDRFAAIGPSAGWSSFRSYAGAPEPVLNDPIAAMFQRATSASDTIELLENLQRLGVYVLHGADDDNVPVTEARLMRKALAEFHPDFVYHEQPGAGHWWGNPCVDWPEMFAFFGLRQRTKVPMVRSIRFRTASPGVSADSDWLMIEMQEAPLITSDVELSLDTSARLFSGRTENVKRLTLHLEMLSTQSGSSDTEVFAAGAPVAVELDGQTLTDVTWPGDGQLRLRRQDGVWDTAGSTPKEWKGPQRYGPFKDVFRNRFLFVYGTIGTDAENEWSFGKARYDAETFWYRGNGAVDVLPDIEYDPTALTGRNVVLYGNADTNAAWTALLNSSPVQVTRHAIRVGDRSWQGEDLAIVFARPMPGNDQALIGVVSGSGMVGMRATYALPFFVSGVEYPDCTVLRADALRNGLDGVICAGFFGEDWMIDDGDFAVRTPQE